eukprot:Gb_21370 [translate_table: standard]
MTGVRPSLSLFLAIFALLFSVLSSRFPTNVAQSSTSFIPAESILMRCGIRGSEQDAEGRTWVGDEGSKFAPHTVNSLSATASSQDPALPSPVPYMTSRIFTSEATYTFAVSVGRHWLRLHFYPSTYGTHDSNDAVFSVISNSYVLLHNFSVAQTAQALTQAYLVREFSVNVTSKQLNVTFTPEKSRKNSYAFINGIEVVSMPDLFHPAPLVGSNDLSYDIGSTTVLQTMARLNVGGQSIPPERDSNLSRTWYDDLPYIYGAADGVTLDNGTGGSVLYTANVPEYVAPQDVYSTFRAMTPDASVNVKYNMTWLLNADANFIYLLRLHFCEWDYTKTNQRVFDIYVNNQTAEEQFDVIGLSGSRGTPVYRDYVIFVPQQSGYTQFWVALHPNDASKPQTLNAILNGLELFKLNDSSGNLAGPNPVPVPQGNVQVPDTEGNGNPSSSSSSSKGPVIGGVTGGIGALGLVLALCCFVRRRRGKSVAGDRPSGWLPLPLYGGNSHTMGSKVSTASGKSGTGSYVSSAPSSFCRHFTFAEIQEATKNFDESLLLGVGGFGKVYEGEIDGGTKVAVKRGNPLAEQGIHEFRTEIEMLSKLRHRHLVSLIGYCEENCEMILVYDYMANGPLRGHLYGSNNLTPLSWKQRLEICIGSARGLHYLHTGAAQTIIHRDVKTTNILLDENLVAKVSDFGLSKTGPTLDHTHVSTVVKGSFGYLDPEYYRRQQLTEKSDVYSFGVVLFEVLCARPAINPSLPREQVSIAEWALQYQKKGILEQIIDPHLKGKINSESLKKFGEAAEKCLAEQGIERPAMGDVLWNLEFALQLQETAMESKLVDDSTTNFVETSPEYNPTNNSGRYLVDSHSTGMSTGGQSLASEDLDDVTPSAVFSQLVNPQGR